MTPRRPAGTRSPATAPHAVPGRRPVAEALRAGRELSEVVVADAEDELGALAHAAGVPVRAADRAELDALSGGVVHQGVVAVAGGYPYADLGSLLGARLLVALDGVTDPHNLGAVARSAEAAGAGGLILRQRRSAGVTPAAEKASAGALSWLPVARVTNLSRTMGTLAEAGVWSVGLDGDAEQALWDCPLLDERVVLAVGAEGGGLSRLVAERVDALVAVPLAGRVASLNASVAAAVALFEIARRRSR